MAKNKPQNEIGELGFEDAIKKLTHIVEKIEAGQVPLQDSIEQYERGMALIKHCRGILTAAEKRIDKISTENAADDNDAQDDNTEDDPEDSDKDAELF